VLRRLETHLFPRLGSRPVGELKTRDLLEPLRELERRGIAEIASRLHQYMNSIMRLAVQQGHIESNPAIDLQGAITTGKSTHRPALPFERIPELLERLDGYKGRLLTRIAVHFCLCLLYAPASYAWLAGLNLIWTVRYGLFLEAALPLRGYAIRPEAPKWGLRT